MKVKEANAVYTGGNIWLFYGTTDDGNYFLTDDNAATLILNADPGQDWDECCFYEWQHEHLIKELEGNEQKDFAKQIMSYLLTHDDDHRGGMTDTEIDAYELYWERYNLI